MGLSNLANSLKGLISRSTSGYSAIPTSVSRDEAIRLEEERIYRRRKLTKLSIGGLALVVILFLVIAHGTSSTPGCEVDAECYNTSRHLWGQYSPFFSVPSDIDASVPEECEITFAQILSRHGARNPTPQMTRKYLGVIEKIHNSTTHYGKGFEFLENFKYELDVAKLTPYGQQEMIDSGIAFYNRYTDLAKASDPFMRAAATPRVKWSGHNFTTGLYMFQDRSGDHLIKEILTMSEQPYRNSTLNHRNCPAFEEGPAAEVMHPKQEEWRETFTPPITKRLNEKLPGANLTSSDTIAMMDLCSYHTLVSVEAPTSEFCRLFSEEEWRGYDYYETLDKWYGYGPGNPLGPTQGIGYLNELIARLTGQPVVDNTNTNRTMTSSPKMFPLNRTMYADFSHDNTMITVMSIIGLFNETEQLPTKYKLGPEKTKGFSSAWTVPMAGRIYFEKMKCGGDLDDDEELIRVLVNDRVIPLRSCRPDSLGRCKLGAFIDSLAFERGGGLWPECYNVPKDESLDGN